MRFDLDFHGDIPEGWIPLEAVIVLKGMSAEENADSEDVGVEWLSTATKGISTWEAAGLLQFALDRLRDQQRGDDAS